MNKLTKIQETILKDQYIEFVVNKYKDSDSEFLKDQLDTLFEEFMECIKSNAEHDQVLIKAVLSATTLDSK